MSLGPWRQTDFLDVDLLWTISVQDPKGSSWEWADKTF